MTAISDFNKEALYAAYNLSPEIGAEAYRKFCDGEEFQSYYIRDGKNIRWYQKILFLIQGFSRIRDSGYYLRTGIFSNATITVQKGKARFLDAHYIKKYDSSKSIDETIQQFLDKRAKKGKKVKKSLDAYKEIDIKAPSKSKKETGSLGKRTITVEIEKKGAVVASCPAQRVDPNKNEDETLIGEVQIGQKKAQFYAVFDGHGGSDGVSKFLRYKLEEVLAPIFSIQFSKKSTLSLLDMKEKCTQIGIDLSNALENEQRPHIKRIKNLYHTIVKKCSIDGTIDLKEMIKPNIPLMRAFLSIPLDDTKEKKPKSYNDLVNMSLLGGLNQLFHEGKTKCSQEVLEEINSLYKNIKLPLFSGSTIALAIVHEGNVWAVNVGDSRIIAVTDDTIDQLTQDTVITDVQFKNYFEKKGGVTEKNSVWGTLGITRAIGNSFLPGVSPKPKVTRFPLQKTTKLLIASDGIFERQTSKEVGTSIQQKKHLSNSELSKELVKEAVESGSLDDITAIVVDLMPKS